MSGDGPERIHEDLLAQQAAFFESYFKKGAEFTRELMQETQRLRARLAELEQKLSDGDRAAELEERYQQIERENNDLAALYVAQSQLHSSLEAAEVVQVLAEVLLNFVGADRFALMVLDAQRELQPLTSAGIPDGDMPENLGSHATVAKLLETGGVACTGFESRPCSEEPVVSIALRSGEGPYGVIGIWGFLGQKEGITILDEQIFDLLANNGGLALQASRVVGEAQQRVRPGTHEGPYERFSRLLP